MNNEIEYKRSESYEDSSKLVTDVEHKEESSRNKKVGDYYLPNLAFPKQEKVNLGKHARLRLNYLKEHKKVLYISLKMENKLTKHLEEIQNSATEMLEKIIKELAEKENITEELKLKNQLKWVGLMNDIKHSAEEIVLKEIIFN